MGRGKHGLPCGQHHVGLPVVDHGQRQQAQAPVVMRVVLRMEELAADVQAVLDAGEASGEVWPILQRLELALQQRLGGYCGPPGRRD